MKNKPLVFFSLAMMINILWASPLWCQVEQDSAKAEPRFFETGTDVYKIVEVMPRFPGCETLGTKQEKEDCSMRKLVEFVYGNVKYPETADGISGTVIVGFIVEKDGSLDHLKIVRDIGGGCGEEALRVVRMMPRWIPGAQHGNPVRVEYQLPVKFSLR